MIEFAAITAFSRGTLYNQLKDAYSFNPQCALHWGEQWQQYDNFMYDNPAIAQKYGFVTVVDGVAVGHITWEPRQQPERVIIGHNCILCSYKGNGYGKAQLSEAVRRIQLNPPQKITVTTNALMLPAQKNYQSVGFVKLRQRPNTDTPFSGDYIDYELICRKNGK